MLGEVAKLQEVPEAMTLMMEAMNQLYGKVENLQVYVCQAMSSQAITIASPARSCVRMFAS